MTVPTLTLNDGVKIPQLGFGTWQISTDDVVAAVSTALEVGYRHIDTAAIYGNEEGVGEAIKASGVARDELFVTTKLWNADHKKADARRGIEESLRKLGLDHVDLYLIHWPATVKYGDSYIEAWDALQEFKAEGLARSIGVSNFTVDNLRAIGGETPSVNQIEVHPSWNNLELRRAMDDRDITCEAWSPLGNGKDHPSDLELDVVKAIANQTGRTPAQVILRWQTQVGNVVFPKSITPERIKQNFEIFDFELSEEQVAAINELPQTGRQGGDPATATF